VSEVDSRLPDYFSLFGLEPAFELDPAALSRAYRTVQAQVHPDRFAAAGAAERRAALQWATLANEAYEVLRSPARRAAYLCERNGIAVSGESAGAMQLDFLDLQLEWRQALEQMREHPDATRLDQLRREAGELRSHELETLARRLDVERDFAGAVDGIRRLQFVDNFLAQLEPAGDSHEAAEAV
jgi:molecular chaperone HscB